jgi:hypothetical protein
MDVTDTAESRRLSSLVLDALRVASEAQRAGYAYDLRACAALCRAT